MTFDVRTTDRTAAGSTQGRDALPETVLPKSVARAHSQKSITSESAVVFVDREHPTATAFEKILREAMK